MPELRRGFSGNYGYSSDSGIRALRTAQNYRNYGYSDGGGIEFRPITEGEDESGPPSPTLWSSSPSRIPEAEASLLHHSSLSPASRKNAIAKGRKEIMEMIRNVPETSYDLSLRDLVEKAHVQISTDKKSNDPKMQSEKGKRKKSQERNKRQMGRSVSMETEPVLLKMFFPTSLGLKKKSLSMDTGSKTPPRSPKLERQEKSIDKEWWKKRYSFAGDSDTVVKSSNNIGSIGSSGSSSSGSSRRRSKIGRLAECWSCFQSKDKTL
ncbi:uncharacterized protein LOC122059749 [Macadamia integrifolia]|uniref:uncharacterized protein LOC122059749 n=1 Tax=Macadamia integrifolia TaxID=60698 RepID=UPI001C5010FA|nr:uncharacterized protein LOC122059749 [Macadamia integrifolia]